MPTGVPYQGHIPPYPAIRVDAFSVPREGDYHVTHLHLLTHTHSDHIMGLESTSFGQLVVCSQDAKNMLLRAEKYPDRIAFDQKKISREVRPWAHLRTHSRGGKKKGLIRDLLRPIAVNKPERYQLDGEEVVSVTAIDANHCPGSVMYLIEGSKGAVLHTGDMRAEPTFVESLKRNPLLAKYIAPEPELDFRNMTGTPSQGKSKELYPTLEAIYLDTACLIGTVDIPTKTAATNDLVHLMGLYPVTTRFFINIWTWGYEDILKAVSKAFGCQIHVDRYKKSIYSSLESDPLLNTITTEDPHSTRFHACERFNRCECVPSEDPEVVYVNAVECPLLTWDVWRKTTLFQLSAGEHVKSLIIPLARHSTLPELQHFVSIFKPKRVVPNTVRPQFQGADWACIPVAFGPIMAPGGAERVMEDMRANGYSIWTDAQKPITKDARLISPDTAGIISRDDPVGFGGLSFIGAGVDVFSSAWENFEAGPDGATSDATILLRGSLNMQEAGQGGRKSRIVQQFDALLRTGNMGGESVAALNQLLKDELGGMPESNGGSQSTDTTASLAREESPEYQDFNMEGGGFEAQLSHVTLAVPIGTDVDSLGEDSSGRGPLSPSPGLPTIPSPPRTKPTVSQDRPEDIPIINFNNLSRRRGKTPSINSPFFGSISIHKARGEPFMGESSTAGARRITPSSTPNSLVNVPSYATVRRPQSDASESVNSVDSPYHDPPDVDPREIEQEQLAAAIATSLNDIIPDSHQLPQSPYSNVPTTTLATIQDPTKSLASSHHPLLSSLTTDSPTSLTALLKVDDQLSAFSGSGLPQKRGLSEHVSNQDVFVSNAKRPRTSTDQNSTSPTRAATPIFPTPRASSSTFHQVTASSTSSSISTRTLRPTARSADPIHLASQKRQRSQLRDLIAKCDRARGADTSISKLQISNSGQHASMANISASSPSLPILPVADESPGSMDIDLVRQLMKDIQNGGTLQLNCVESQ